MRQLEAGIPRVKVNCTLVSNGEDEIADIAALAKTRDISVRFIEMMPIGLGKGFETMSEEAVRELLLLVRRFDPVFRAAWEWIGQILQY